MPSPWIVLTALAALPSAADGPPTVEQSLAAFRLADPALKIELVAREPEIGSPTAIAWDADGALFVVEMSDYPDAAVGGRIKKLVDADGDGRYEKATVFADGLRFPNGVLPWRDGILVTAAPDLIHFQDTDGDGKADVRRVILTGFGEGNQQLRVNSPTWGLDNRVYLANGRSGGSIRKPSDPAERGVPIPRNDLRLNPDDGTFDPIAGFSQFGLPRDDYGNRFPSWNTVPIRHVVIEEKYLARRTFLSDARSVAEILDLADGGRVFSLAPAQTRFNAESVAFFNATCGPTIFRGTALGEDYLGHALVCEPLSSLVHHRRLVPDGPTFRAVRVEAGKEFLASIHPWFRPVNLATGPDGALYVVDFCRALVEHPAFVPAQRRGEVDFREGNEKGRIWRISRRDGATVKPVFPSRGTSIESLVGMLDSPNAWQRDTAQRLLVERKDPASPPILSRFARTAGTEKGRIHGLWTLDGINALDDGAIRDALADTRPRVREQAARLAEGRPALVVDLAALADDPDPRVRFRVALSLPVSDAPAVRRARARILARDAESPWTTTAVLSGISPEAEGFLAELLSPGNGWDTEENLPRADLLKRLASIAAASGKRDAVAALVRRAAEFKADAPGFALVLGLGREATDAVSPETRAVFVRRAEAALGARDKSGRTRAYAFQVSALLDPKGIAASLPTRFEPGEAEAVREAASSFLGKSGDASAADRVLSAWDRLSLEGRRSVVSALVTSNVLADRLLSAVEKGTIRPDELDPAARDALRKTNAEGIRRRVATLFAATETQSRAEALRRHEAAATQTGDAERGRELFSKNCATCHTRGGGTKVGPDLLTVAGRPAADLLTAILDPSREAAPDGIGVVVATADGRTLTGLLVEDSPRVVRLKRADAAEDVIPRSEVEAVRSTGKSLMPEGLEQILGTRDLADLIAFLRSPAAGTAR